MPILARPSIFREMAKKYPYAWERLKGLEILHYYWGFCQIEEISLPENSSV